METVIILIYMYFMLRLAIGARLRTSRKKKAYHVMRAVLWPVRLVMKLEKWVREALIRVVM